MEKDDSEDHGTPLNIARHPEWTCDRSPNKYKADYVEHPNEAPGKSAMVEKLYKVE